MLLDDERHVVKWLSQYGALPKAQVIRLLRDKSPQTAEKIIRNLKRDLRISDVGGGYYLGLDDMCKPDQRIILAVWVLLRFIDYVDPMAHYPAVYPSQLFFLKGNTGYEIVVLYDGEQHLTKLLQPQDEDMKYIIVLPNINMAPQLILPQAPCLFATVNFSGQEEPDITFYAEEVAANGNERILARTLAKFENQLRKLDMAAKNTRYMFEIGNMELAYEVALRLADVSERITLLARALPAYTGNPLAAQDVENLIRQHISVEIGFTMEGWFCVRIPLLLPKKEAGSANYIRSFLYPAIREFFADKPPVRYSDCVLIYRHVYDQKRPERQRRDHDNIEINMVSDIIALYVMDDDAPSLCRHYYCSAAGSEERTEVYVVPTCDFPNWLITEKVIPDEGVMLYENDPGRGKKGM